MTDQQVLQGWITIGITCLGGIVGFLAVFLRILFKQFKDLIMNNTEAMTNLRETVGEIASTLSDHEVRIGKVETIHEVRGCSTYHPEDN